MSVFTETNISLSQLRDCQIEACNAAKEHYSQTSVELQTLVQLPTGTGKSALIAALPFYVPCERVLVLVPNLSLITQMKEDLDLDDHPDTNAYKKFGLLDDQQIASTEIFVLPLSKKVNRTDIQDHQVIVANYQKFQDVEKWFGTNNDLIDLIIIDEAHHQAAKTYQELLNFFNKAKIIGLTATPFRSDGKPVQGKKIYTYHFKQAVQKHYIRNIRVNNVSPNEISVVFTGDGGSKNYTLDELMTMKEKAWFNHGIALSQDCCDSIADLAVEKLNSLRREFPKAEHQIIAAAISIRHAREFIKPAFERHNLRIGIVSSDNEDMPHNEKIKSDLKNGKLDVVINIGMLGEGFNQPTLGVAAIFRPFKSLNPYVQFVGRVLRTNQDTKYCYVVSHLGLNQVRRFDEFKLFDSDDKEFMTTLFTDQTPSSNPEDDIFVEEEKYVEKSQNDAKDFEIKQSGTLLDISSSFVDEDRVQTQIDGFNQMKPEERAKFLSSLGIDEGSIAQIIPKKIKPIQKRLAKKNRLNEVAKSITTDVLKSIGVKIQGHDINVMFTNFQWVLKRVNITVNKALGIAKKERNNLTVQQLDAFASSSSVDSIKLEMIDYFTVKLQEQRDKSTK